MIIEFDGGQLISDLVRERGRKMSLLSHPFMFPNF